MKHALLREVWRIRDEISAECGHDVRRLAALVRREEARNANRLVVAPKPTARKDKRAAFAAKG